MDLLRISLVQPDIVWENPLANRSKLDRLLAPLKGTTDLILLPEMFTTGFSMKVRELAEEMDGESVAWMKRWAADISSAIAGSLIIKENNHFFNRFVFVTPEAEITFYDKRHLFSMGMEDYFFQKGNRRVVVNYAGWRIALFVCYDLRFPVWCRSLGEADLVLFTANWPGKRKIVWQTLTRARAIENQLYVAASNRTGTDGEGVSYSGESLVISPKGDFLCDLGNRMNSTGTCILSLSELNLFREKFPVARDEDTFEIRN